MDPLEKFVKSQFEKENCNYVMSDLNYLNKFYERYIGFIKSQKEILGDDSKFLDYIQKSMIELKRYVASHGKDIHFETEEAYKLVAVAYRSVFEEFVRQKKS